MKRKLHRPSKAELIGRLHRGLRPKLSASQITALALGHLTNFEVIAKGHADEQVLMEWVGGALSWSRVAQTLAENHPEALVEAARAMEAQLQACNGVLERFARVGRIAFTGPEFTAAKDAIGWMDALAEFCDVTTAIDATEWSELQIRRISDQGLRLLRLGASLDLRTMSR